MEIKLISMTGADFVLKKGPFNWYVLGGPNGTISPWPANPNKKKLLKMLKEQLGIVPI